MRRGHVTKHFVSSPRLMEETLCHGVATTALGHATQSRPSHFPTRSIGTSSMYVLCKGKSVGNSLNIHRVHGQCRVFF